MGSLLRGITGCRDAVTTLARRANPQGTVVVVVGVAQPAEYVCVNGGSQVLDERTGLLLALEMPLGIFTAAEREDFEVRLRWVCRCFIQVADDPRKFEDRVGSPLSPERLAYSLQALRPVGLSASPPNITCACFNALTQDRRGTVQFVLLIFHEL